MGTGLRRIGLQGRIVAILLLASLLPLALTCVGAWVVFGRQLKDSSLDLQREVVEAHASAIEAYLAEKLRALELVARTRSFEELCGREGLRELFEDLNDCHGGAFVDLGVIGSNGDHLAYVGPYDLGDKNYARAGWFRDVRMQGSYVSNVFLGYRGVPHCVMAVRRQEGDRWWILRATINSEKFDALVRTGRLGSTGDAFIVDAEGVYQTPPRQGRVLGRSPLSPAVHQGVRERRVTSVGTAVVQTTTWLDGGRWMLVVQQDEAEIMAPLKRATMWGGLVVLLSVALLVVTIIAATRHLTGRIDRANEERERLSRDFMRSAKLASLGELSTGLAHEINNPLAIICTELTNISDLVGDMDASTPGLGEVAGSIGRCSRQVDRCSAITSKMLQFGRQTSALPRPTDVGPKLVEIADLMRKQASVRNVDLQVDVEPDLPRVELDPTELQQVIVNLVNNSLYAIEGRGTIVVSAGRERDEVLVSVRDTGSGIPREDREKIFQPFFSTKPVGRGTGLGLSVCYGIVRGWGGTIRADSEEGAGTRMTIRLPVCRGAQGKQASTSKQEVIHV